MHYGRTDGRTDRQTLIHRTLPAKSGVQQMTCFQENNENVYFWTNLGQMRFFTKTLLHHLKRAMVFYFYAKNYKKQLNGSRDIVVWKIEWSDWSRAFEPKSREPEFSRTWGLHRNLDNNKTLNFRPFPAKTNKSILWNYRNSQFLGHFGPFLPKFGQTRYFGENRAVSLLSVYGPITSCKRSEKNNEPIPRKVH